MTTQTEGLRLHELRTSAGLTQMELAALSDISQPTISLIERGGVTTTRTLEALAEALGCEVRHLWTINDD